MCVILAKFLLFAEKKVLVEFSQEPQIIFPFSIYIVCINCPKWSKFAKTNTNSRHISHENKFYEKIGLYKACIVYKCERRRSRGQRARESSEKKEDELHQLLSQGLCFLSYLTCCNVAYRT